MFANLDPEAYDRKYGDRELFRRTWSYIARDRRLIATVVLSTILLGLLSASVPILISRGVGLLAGHADPSRMVVLVVAAYVAGVSIWLVNWARRRSLARAIGDTVLAMRHDAFAATMHQDLSFFDEHSSGRVVSRITSDTNDFGQTVTLVADLVSQFLQLAILTTVLFAISWRLTLVVLLWAPFVVLMAWVWRIAARRVTQQGNRAMAEVNSTIHETVAGIGVAKNFRRESTIYGAFDRVNRLSYGINVRRGLVLSAVFPVLNVLVGFGNALLVYVGALGVAAGALMIGSWYLFLQSIEAFFFPLINLASFWSQVQIGLAAVERVFALIDADATVVQTDAQHVPRLRGELQFDGVGFRYRDDGEEVLDDFDLHVRAGEVVALVGHTGAGKSSIAKLIGRSYEFQKGRLLLDGRDVRTFDLAEYRRQLGVVPQSPFLFSGTVIENVRYANPDATIEKIEGIARRIGNGEWLDMLPDGLETNVGERGARLSMGERQLIALMRVLVQDPSVFILDEATASIDPFTESQIQEALGLILANTTSIIIAHRLSTVRAVDRIIVLERGRIIEEGSHDALMAAGGTYADLYDTYFRHQSLDYHVMADGTVLGGAATEEARP